MSQDYMMYMTSGAIALTALMIMTLAALRGWRDWIALKRAEMTEFGRHAPGMMADMPAAPTAMNRIEIADLRERVRKLEAIAAGVDL